MDILKEITLEKLNTERFIVDLSEEVDDNLKESDDTQDYNFVIDDDEWGNDF